MKLRHAPLLIVREMARHATHRRLVAETLERVIQRADELAEFVAIYWKDGRVPLPAQVKKGLAAAFPKFDEYPACQVRPWRADQAAGRALPLARQATRCGAGGRLEEACLGTPRYARHLGSGRCRSPARKVKAAMASKSDKREAWSGCSASRSWARWRCSATFATCARQEWPKRLCPERSAR